MLWSLRGSAVQIPADKERPCADLEGSRLASAPVMHARSLPPTKHLCSVGRRTPVGWSRKPHNLGLEGPELEFLLHH